VPDYRVYTLGEDGHIKGRTADGHAVEVWEYDRRIALIDGKTARLRLARCTLSHRRSQSVIVEHCSRARSRASSASRQVAVNGKPLGLLSQNEHPPARGDYFFGLLHGQQR
jgi:hypothetical protein